MWWVGYSWRIKTKKRKKGGEPGGQTQRGFKMESKGGQKKRLKKERKKKTVDRLFSFWEKGGKRGKGQGGEDPAL